MAKMDPSLAKAVIGGGALTAFVALVVGFLTAFTSRRGNQIAERKMLIEADTATLKEAREWREENRTDMRREQEHSAALQLRLTHLEALYEARVIACRTCGYPCLLVLKEQAREGVSPPLIPLPPPTEPMETPSDSDRAA